MNDTKHEEIKKLEEVVFLVFIELLILFIFRAYLPQSDSDSYLVAKVALYIFDILFVVFMVKVIDHERISFIGIDFKNIFSQLLKGFLIFAVLLVTYALPYYFIIGLDQVHMHTNRLFTQILMNIFLIALAEEMLFRGLILERLKQLMSSDIKAILICSFLSGVSQYPLTHNTTLLFMYVYLGLILSIIRVKFKTKIFSLALAHGLMLSTFNLIVYFIG